MNSLLALITLLLVSAPLQTTAQQPIVVTAAPAIFAPGIISGPANDGAPTFSPDGNTLYFSRANNSWGFILESHKVAGVWQKPTIAPFSGQWSDQQPAFSPNGQRLVFVSHRMPATTPATGVVVGRAAAIWVVDKIGSGWSEPKRLPDTVNLSSRVFKPSLAADGSLYFMAKTDDARTWRLYRSQYSHGTYLHAEALSFSDGNHTDVDPQIAPDESFLIFSSSGRATADDPHEHLYIAFKNGTAWENIQPLRYDGDYEKNPCDDGEANLGPDRRTLYFNSGRANPIHKDRSREQAKQDFEMLNTWDNSNSNVWTISLAPWLDTAQRTSL